MLPFASALAIASLGQTLVVMQGGIDLSVAGGFSLYVVIVTKYPAGDNSRLWPAIGIAVLAADRSRPVERVPGRSNATQPDRRDARDERVALRCRALVHGGDPDDDNGAPGEGRRRDLARHPSTGVLRGGRNRAGHGGGQADAGGSPIRRRRRQRVSRAHGRASGCNGIGAAAYLWAQLLYCLAAILHAGIVNQPTAYEGNNYLLPTVAAVVLGGTSLLGGRGNLVATALAALFLSQLDQFVLALGVSFATRTLVQAGSARRGRRALHRRLGSSDAPRHQAPSGERRPDMSRNASRTSTNTEVPLDTEEGGQRTNDPQGEVERCSRSRSSASACSSTCDGVVRAGQLPSRRGAARRRSSSASRTGSAETAGVS